MGMFAGKITLLKDVVNIDKGIKQFNNEFVVKGVIFFFANFDRKHFDVLIGFKVVGIIRVDLI